MVDLGYPVVTLEIAVGHLPHSPSCSHVAIKSESRRVLQSHINIMIVPFVLHSPPWLDSIPHHDWRECSSDLLQLVWGR